MSGVALHGYAADTTEFWTAALAQFARAWRSRQYNVS
jgi:hypothetical protein